MQLRSYTCKCQPFVLKGTSSCPASATREEDQFIQTMDGHSWHVRNTFVEVVSDASNTNGTECCRSRSEPPSEVGRPLDLEIMVDTYGLRNPSQWVEPVAQLTPTPMNSQVTPVLADITNTVDVRPRRWADMTDDPDPADFATWWRRMVPRIAGLVKSAASQQESEMEPEPEALQRSTLLSTWPFE